ncbi:MAG: STAS domain-containing protein [Methylococcaceae bacterium]|nr:STAS domain-containing protein [Methylococcaceae bacterium]
MIKDILTLRSTRGLMDTWQADMKAGFLVSLIALPLCFGIATASGFPPIAGIISAIVGGLLISHINGVPLGITGPAAGLITVLFSAVQTLGQGDHWAGYRYTLAAVVISGGLQILLGLSRTSRIAALFPAAIAHGMLAAIGISIIARQAHILLGTRPEVDTVWQSLTQIPGSLFYFNPLILLVGGIGLVILFAWPMLGQRGLGRMPAPIAAVVTGILLGQSFNLETAELYVKTDDDAGLLHQLVYTKAPQFLAEIPDRWQDSLVFPDFGQLATPGFWGAVTALFLVGSLESLLVASAVDRLGKTSAHTDLNRDIAAIGLGNVVSGLIGGLPMVVEIVRSSANIGYGARSANANFFHGLFLLLFVALLPQWLERIPLATLAALLVFAGYRLASPSTFTHAKRIGTEQIALFILTLVAVLTTNILAGVAIGLIAKLILSRWLGGQGTTLRGLLSPSYQATQTLDGSFHFRIDGPAVFSNFLRLKGELRALPQGERIVIDVSAAPLIDHTVMDFIERFGETYMRTGGQLVIVGLNSLAARSAHPLATRTQKIQRQ